MLCFSEQSTQEMTGHKYKILDKCCAENAYNNIGDIF